MTRKIIAFAILVIVFTGIGIGIYFFFFFDNSRQGPDIILGKRYYINELMPGMYSYSAVDTNSNASDFITLETRDNTYCVFEDNFKKLRIVFESEGALLPRAEFGCVMSKIEQSRGKLTATAHHIYNGMILTYNITTTKNKIVFNASATYKIMVATKDNVESSLLTVTRNSVVMSFLRIAPNYIP